MAAGVPLITPGNATFKEIGPMRNSKSFGKMFGVGMVMCVLWLAASKAQAQSSAEDRAHRVLARHQTTIVAFMHPTADFNSKTFLARNVYSSGNFRLSYRYYFTSAFGNPFSSELHFNFFRDGRLDYIGIGPATGLVNPFTAANQAINWAKQEILNDSNIRDSETLVRLIEQGNAQRVLEWVLKNLP